MENVEYIPGGAGQNTTRICQWMLQVPHATSYMGCIGEDEFGRKMTEVATAEGVNVSVGSILTLSGRRLCAWAEYAVDRLSGCARGRLLDFPPARLRVPGPPPHLQSHMQ